MKSFLLLGASALATVVAINSAQAQESPRSAAAGAGNTIDELVVTAEKRAESLQDIPTAISAYAADSLADRGITRLEHLKFIAPSFQLGSSRGASNNALIRGIGGFAGEEPAVAQLQDGMPYTTTGFGNLAGLGAVSFFDAERVEVLRGPQGTLGGRNATAGGVYVTSKRPTPDFEGYGKAAFGNYNRLSLEGAASGPVWGDKLLARIALRTDRADGWIENTVLNEDIYGIDEREVRVSLLAQPTEAFSALLILQADQNRARPVQLAGGRVRPDRPTIYEVRGVPVSDPDSKAAQLDQRTFTNQERGQAILNLDWDLGIAKLTSITGYVKRTARDSHDEDGSTIPVQVVGRGLFNSNAWQWSQEFTLTADLGDRADLIVGGLYAQNRRYTEVRLGLPLLGLPPESLFIYDLKSLRSRGAYAQLRWRLTDQLRLTAGARYVKDSKTGSGIQDVFNGVVIRQANNRGVWDAWTPRVSLDWQPSDDLTVYATAARGFKSGGIEMATFPARNFAPEYVWNYEAGVKFAALDQRVRGTVAVFNMDYTNLQQTIGGLEPGVISFRTVNAAKASIKGVELTLDGQVSEQLRISAAGAYLDAKYQDLRSFDQLYPELGTPGPSGQNVRDLSGNRLAGAPEWQFNLAGEYTTPVGGTLEAVFRASYAWQSDAPNSIYNHPGQALDSYGVVNLSASLQTAGGDWQVTAFAENAADKRYMIGRGGSTNFTNGAPTSVVFLGDPRRYGVRLERRF